MVIKISNKYWWMLWTKYNNYKKIHIVISIAIIIHLFYIGAQNNDPCALKDPLWKKRPFVQERPSHLSFQFLVDKLNIINVNM